jgi:hypothetical protein
MKKTNSFHLVFTGMIVMSIFACSKIKEPVAAPAGPANETNLSGAKITACPAVYALVLSASSGSPVPAGLQSFIYKVGLCPNSFTFVSQIKIGLTPVTDVTGICDVAGIPNLAFAVTGRNSNFPSRILKVQISTGASGIESISTVPLQDIENFGSKALFVAIQEGTSQLMKVDIGTGVCVPFAPPGPTIQYNGLAVVGNKFHAISGTTSFICSPLSGDIFEYNASGGPYVAKYSYKNLPVNGTWTMKELGLFFDPCCGKGWVVGSSSGILSNNTNVTPCVAPTPTFNFNTRFIYDFMIKP